MKIILYFLISIVLIIVSFFIGKIVSDYNLIHKVDERQRDFERVRAQYLLLNRWFSLVNEGINLEQVLIDKGYKSIAIYGMADLGERLLESLKDSQIEVKYGVDIAKYGSRKDFEIKNLDHTLEPVNAVIVTAFLNFEDVAVQLRKRLSADIISLEDLIESL